MAIDDEDPNSEIFAEFIAESRETLDRVEPLLIELETKCNSETLNVIFRCFHSFKGTASFIGLDTSARLAHSAESLLDLFRLGAKIEHAHIDALCSAIDTLRTVLDAIEVTSSDAELDEQCRPVTNKLDGFVDMMRARRAASRRGEDVGGSTPPTSPAQKPAIPATEGNTSRDSFSITSPHHNPWTGQELLQQLQPDLIARFVTESEEHLACIEETMVAMESGRLSAEQVDQAFRAMHSLKGNCGICGCGDMEMLTHHAETLLGRTRAGSLSLDASAGALLLEVVDALRSALAGVPEGHNRIGNLAGFVQRLQAAATATAPAETSNRDELRLMNDAPLRAEQAGPDGAEKTPPAAAELGKGPRGAASIRVDTDKLDELMNLVGELIIAETTVTKNPDLDGHEFENFQKAALHLNRLTRALQDIAMAVRMVPIESTFRKMIRLIRDVSTKQKKRVELTIVGEETEVDKSVVETIADPLVHLIRNAVDHGIEPGDERVAKGKPATGHVWLSARHQGGEVWITLRDDGRGLDREKILRKAIDKGLADPGQRYSDREVVDKIFLPGFSTAAAVTDISGRGVGMDVVRRNIEGVGGRIEITSELGLGTTFTMRIPLTLAIIEGMLVKVGRSYYTIPLLAIRESVRAYHKDITVTPDGCELLHLRRKHHPIVRIHQLHAVANAQQSIEHGILVIVETGAALACLLVDEVVGQCQTVIKPLPEYVRQVRGLSGCSILHNGEISLILDVEGVVGAAQMRAA